MDVPRRWGVCFLIGITTAVEAQPCCGGARELALAGAAAATRSVVWTGANPAALAAEPDRQFGVTTMRLFGMRELSQFDAGYVGPFGPVHAAVTLGTFGFSAFRQSRFALTLFRRQSASERARLALRLETRHQRIGGLGGSGAATVSVGWLVPLAGDTRLGIGVQHLIAKASAGHAPQVRLLVLGLERSLRSGNRLYVAADKDAHHRASFRGAFEWRPVPALLFRIGSSTSPTRFATGIGLRLRGLHVDLSGSRHAALGWTPALTTVCIW